MNKILITGKDSYVGNNVEKWLMKKPNRFNVETLDMKTTGSREGEKSNGYLCRSAKVLFRH